MSATFADEKAFGKHELGEGKMHDASSETHTASGEPNAELGVGHTELKRQLKNRHIAMIRCVSWFSWSPPSFVNLG